MHLCMHICMHMICGHICMRLGFLRDSMSQVNNIFFVHRALHGTIRLGHLRSKVCNCTIEYTPHRVWVEKSRTKPRLNGKTRAVRRTESPSQEQNNTKSINKNHIICPRAMPRRTGRSSFFYGSVPDWRVQYETTHAASEGKHSLPSTSMRCLNKLGRSR